MADRELLDTVYAPKPAAKPWRFQELLAPAQIRYYGLGRAALTDALRAIGLRRGDAVLFPELICHEVIDSATTMRCQPLFYPVTPEMTPASPHREWPAARVVVAVNYFGFPQDLLPFRAYAERTKAIVLEDNAHGLFSRAADGTWLGLRGDAGVFSPRKTIPVPNGGILAIPPGSPVPLPAAGAFQAGTPAGFKVKQALRLSVPRLGTRHVRLLQKLSRRLRSDRKAAMPEGILVPVTMLTQPMLAPDPDAEIARRRALYEWSHARVTGLGGRPIFSSLPAGVAPFVFPFRADEPAARAIDEAFDREGLDVFPWPKLPTEIEPSAPAHYRDIRCVRFLW